MNRLLLIVGLMGVAGVARAADEEKKYQPIDSQPKANQKRADSLGSGSEGSNLAKGPGGEQKFGDIKFKVEDRILHLGSNVLDRHPDKVLGIRVDAKCANLHILHGTCFGGGPNKEG